MNIDYIYVVNIHLLFSFYMYFLILTKNFLTFIVNEFISLN